MMKLHQLSVEDGIDVYNMLQRIERDANAFNNEVNGMSFEDYKSWLIRQDCWSRGEELPEGYVTQWVYWLYDGITPVGYGKLRSEITEQSRKFGGNLGFSIDPQQRGKGYGTILLKLLLEEARKKNIEELFSTVEKFNYPSKVIHEKNGGKLVDENEIRWFFEFK